MSLTKSNAMKPIVIAPIIVLLGALPTLAAAQQQNSSVACDVSHQLNCNVHTNNTGWNDFGNFGKILGFKANFPTGLAYNGSGVFIPWSKICGQGQAYLVQPCSALIDSNGVLTDVGNHAVHCIRNGAVLGVVAIKLGLPVNLAKSIIGGLAGMTGCSGIVDMNKIQLSNETQFLVRNIGQ